MKVFRAAAVIALLTSPVHAQAPHVNLLGDGPPKTAEEREAEAERDKAYKESLKKIPNAKASTDPWGNVRSVETSKPTASKPRAKSGSAAN